MNDIEIRKMNKSDEIPYDLLLLADPSKDLIDSYIKNSNSFIAQKEDKIVGICVVIKIKTDIFEIVNIAVDETCQRKGIAKKLIYNVIEFLKLKGAKELYIGTGNSSIYQLALYQKCGFRIVGIDKDFFKRNYKDKIIENEIECVDMIRLKMKL
ncbi:GNAT family N-acetyltransferase [Peptostreptococcaceae bacterium AGR-M142]